MNKKQVTTIITICVLITAGAIYFSSLNKKGGNYNYCDYQKNGWENCNGKTITISGLNPFSENSGMGILQHPISIKSQSLTQSYLDTTQGQIVLLSNGKINCPEKMTITGKLDTKYGPCDLGAAGKSSYCGSSIIVTSWECN